MSSLFSQCTMSLLLLPILLGLTPLQLRHESGAEITQGSAWFCVKAKKATTTCPWNSLHSAYVTAASSGQFCCRDVVMWISSPKLSVKLRRSAVYFFHLHMPLQATSTGLGHSSVRIVGSCCRWNNTFPVHGDWGGSYPMCRCQVMDGQWLVEASPSGLVEDVLEQGVGSAGCRSPKQHASRALPWPSGFQLGGPGEPSSGALIRVPWDPQVSCHSGSTNTSYKHCRITGYRELFFSVDVIDPKVRCVYFCQQYPSYSTLHLE